MVVSLLDVLSESPESHLLTLVFFCLSKTHAALDYPRLHPCLRLFHMCFVETISVALHMRIAVQEGSLEGPGEDLRT